MSTRDEFVAGMKVRLDVWNVAIDELEAKILQLEAQTSQDLHARVDALKAKRDDVTDKLKEIQDGPEDTWENVQTEVRRIWHDLKQSFEEINDAMR